MTATFRLFGHLLFYCGSTRQLAGRHHTYSTISKQPSLPAEAVAQTELMRRVLDATVQRTARRVELVAVAYSKAPEVQLNHARQIPVATNINPHTECFLH